MCGFAGEFRLDAGTADSAAVAAACRRLAHRGPDDEGQWSSGAAALGFRRLSILDLEGGHQPMRSEDGRLTVVFNGEIYNHPRLKRELEAQGVRYRTRSDTETILRLYEREGAEAFRRLEGMFAIAIHDAKAGELVLARDPIGVKPLYYREDAGSLAFASELRALATMIREPRLDPAGALDYLRFGFVHSPRTILAGARKLPPGHWLAAGPRGVRLRKFWELPSRPAWSKEPSLPEAEAEVERLLEDAVRSQLLSDVPVGAFLSGGVDSSLIAAIMAREAGAGKVKTFSIGFSGAKRGLDESAYARAVARHLGTDHRELVLPAGVLEDAGTLAECLDEPIADSAILPTYLLSRFARQEVKVVLTGEGADELFAGYNRYKAAYLSERINGIPAWGRPLAAFAGRRMGSGRAFDGLPMTDLGAWAEANAHCALSEAEALCRPDFLGTAAPQEALEWLGDPRAPQDLKAALAFDLRTVLADCLLMKADKSSMRASLEARVPYLDSRLVEYALHLPASLKLRRFKGKYLLRRIADKRLPAGIAWRKKHGFVVPWEEWVRAPKNALLDDLVGGAFRGWDAFDEEKLLRLLAGVRAGDPRADAGLLYRVAVLGLWLDALTKKAAVRT